MPMFETRGRFKFEPAQGEATLSGVVVTLNDKGLATEARPLRIGGVLQQTG
jgi:hypothetical protein